jgi:hypothetical protein
MTESVSKFKSTKANRWFQAVMLAAGEHARLEADASAQRLAVKSALARALLAYRQKAHETAARYRAELKATASRKVEIAENMLRADRYYDAQLARFVHSPTDGEEVKRFAQDKSEEIRVSAKALREVHEADLRNVEREYERTEKNVAVFLEYGVDEESEAPSLAVTDEEIEKQLVFYRSTFQLGEPFSFPDEVREVEAATRNLHDLDANYARLRKDMDASAEAVRPRSFTVDAVRFSVQAVKRRLVVAIEVDGKPVALCDVGTLSALRDWIVENFEAR